ncbi:putative membrane protein [Escherichia coli DEC4B]|nr:putative membrane protein [Escherichia coli DEC3D]EHU93135.1 putative membrane protein [Escherichia coli DEC4B]EHV20050.1 putative membrane protein [Escherichia coli DEC4F]
MSRIFDLVFFDIFSALNIALFKLTFSSHHLYIETCVFFGFYSVAILAFFNHKLM